MIVHGRDLTGDLALDVDAVVVGTGAGGSVALRELSRAGLKVVAFEEGAHHTPQDFTQREDQMFPALYADGGGRTTSDLAIRILSGRGVGGSTVHNTNLCKRTPEPILDLWARKYGVSGASAAEMEPSFAAIERDLSVSPIPAALLNGNNDVMRRGVEALGWRGGMLSHNRIGCRGSGFCELGCAYDAKQNALKIVLPQATSAGATIYSDTRVERVTFEGGGGGRVTGVIATARDGQGRAKATITVRARVVVLSASAIGSAALAVASGVPDPYAQLGRGVRLHPAGVVAGNFDPAPLSGQGIPQSYECTEWLDLAEGSDRRVWLVPVFAHLVGVASLLPGFGAAHMRSLRQLNSLAVVTAMVHDETSGTLSVDGDGRPRLDYALSESDRRQLALGLHAGAKILFAAGAREVSFPAIPPVTIRSARELDRLDMSFVRPHGVPLSSVHPMGGMRMGDDPRSSTVSSTGEHHQLKGLFVADGSLFPTSLGGPPQISIYSFALHLAPRIIERARG
jgi:choline dehydrogenase-like flavoprotein